MNIDAVAGPRTDTVYSRCVRCRAVFRRDGEHQFIAVPDDALRRALWVVPPWVETTDPTSFEMSWDVTQGFFERLSQQHPFIGPLFALVLELRAAGFGPRLRAGQSLSSFGLSRAREHGLRPEQSHLFLDPQRDGEIRLSGIIGARAFELGPLLPTFAGELQQHIEALADLPID